MQEYDLELLLFTESTESILLVSYNPSTRLFLKVTVVGIHEGETKEEERLGTNILVCSSGFDVEPSYTSFRPTQQDVRRW